MKDWVVPIVVALIGIGSAGGFVPLIQALRGRGKAKVDAAAVLQDTAQEWVTDFKKETSEARQEAREAREELHRVRSATTAELQRVREEATALADELHRLRLAIFAPNVTIDGLRELVRRGSGPATNGRT